MNIKLLTLAVATASSAAFAAPLTSENARNQILLNDTALNTYALISQTENQVSAVDSNNFAFVGEVLGLKLGVETDNYFASGNLTRIFTAVPSPVGDLGLRVSIGMDNDSSLSDSNGLRDADGNNNVIPLFDTNYTYVLGSNEHTSNVDDNSVNNAETLLGLAAQAEVAGMLVELNYSRRGTSSVDTLDYQTTRLTRNPINSSVVSRAGRESNVVDSSKYADNDLSASLRLPLLGTQFRLGLTVNPYTQTDNNRSVVRTWSDLDGDASNPLDSDQTVTLETQTEDAQLWLFVNGGIHHQISLEQANIIIEQSLSLGRNSQSVITTTVESKTINHLDAAANVTNPKGVTAMTTASDLYLWAPYSASLQLPLGEKWQVMMGVNGSLFNWSSSHEGLDAKKLNAAGDGYEADYSATTADNGSLNTGYSSTYNIGLSYEPVQNLVFDAYFNKGFVTSPLTTQSFVTQLGLTYNF